MKTILLTQGKSAIVDDADYDRLAIYNWYAQRGWGENWYATRGIGVLMHRKILGLSSGGLPVDHINGNGLDNQRANLRIATPSQNARNRKPNSNLVGISQLGDQRYGARIWVNGRQTFLGVFATQAEACEARRCAEKRYFGEFAYSQRPFEDKPILLDPGIRQKRRVLYPRRSLAERFWPKVERRGPNDCWWWQAGKHPFGHGRIWGGVRNEFAHRVAYELVIGPIPSGMCVCHQCDQPGCVNPAHLFLGTWGDNVRDTVRKGRYIQPHPQPDHLPRGDRHWMRIHPERILRGGRIHTAKLTEEDVWRIRILAVDSYSNCTLAKMFGVSSSAIGKVVRRETWVHI